MTRTETKASKIGNVAILLMVLLAITAAPVSTGATSGDETVPGERVSVLLRVLGTDYDDGIDGATDPQGSAGNTLEVGESGTSYVAVGAFDETGRAAGHLCSNATGTSDRRDWLVERAPHAWIVDYRVLDAGVDRIELEVSWEHLVMRRPGEVASSTGDTRRIVLREGDRHVLDFLAAEVSLAERPCSRNVLVELTASIAEDPEFAGAKLDYDLWLQYRGAEGRKTTRRFHAIGLQGEEVEFRFPSLRFPVPEQRLGGEALEAIVDVSGEVRGRLRSDGSIVLVLDAARWMDVEVAGRPRRGGIGDGGRKTFSVRPGETVQLDLPESHGGSYLAVSGDVVSGTVSEGSADVQDLGPERVGVQFGEFFAGSGFSLVLTVTREG